MAECVRKSEFIGTGCLVQALGLIAPVAGLAVSETGLLAGLLLMVVLLAAGSRMSIKYICSACGNRLMEKHAMMCPSCRQPLD